MKYKKGEKLESIGAVYEHLYDWGLVLEFDPCGIEYVYKDTNGRLQFREIDGDAFTDYSERLSVDECIHYKALKEEEEPLKMPEFFKTYKHKTNSDIGIVTSISNSKVFICGYFWQLKDFWDTFEEAE